MTDTTLTEAQSWFRELWAKITFSGNRPSECLAAIGRALSECFGGDASSLGRLMDRLEHTTSIWEKDSWIYHGPSMIRKAEGEWNITNADLLFWRELCFSVKQDVGAPKPWRMMEHLISPRLHAVRRWQTYKRYQARGGLNADHLKLLGKVSWHSNLYRGDGASLYVEGKRPFGNSGIEDDMFGLLGWDVAPENLEEGSERAWELFDELQFALIDVIANAKDGNQPPPLVRVSAPQEDGRTVAHTVPEAKRMAKERGPLDTSKIIGQWPGDESDEEIAQAYGGPGEVIDGEWRPKDDCWRAMRGMRRVGSPRQQLADFVRVMERAAEYCVLSMLNPGCFRPWCYEGKQTARVKVVKDARDRLLDKGVIERSWRRTGNGGRVATYRIKKGG